MGRDLEQDPSKNAVIKVKDKNKVNKDSKLECRSRSPSAENRSSATSPSPDPTQKTTSSPSTTSTSFSDLLHRSISFETLSSYVKNTLLPDEEEEKKVKMLVRPEICRLPLAQVSKIGLSLSGCGFLGSYHFGAISCFLKNGEPLLHRLERVSGASAGSLVAAVLVLSPEKIEKGLKEWYEMADELNSLKFGAMTPGYNLNDRLAKVIDPYIPENVEKANNKLYVSVTEYKTRQNRLISDFPDRKLLMKSLMASCYIPMYSMNFNAVPPYINGNYYIDGGYTNNLPDFEDVRMITISPFSGAADISPPDFKLFDWQMKLGSQQINVNLQNIVRGAQALFPPKRRVLEHYYDQGYKDAFRFLIDHKLVKRGGGGTPV